MPALKWLAKRAKVSLDKAEEKWHKASNIVKDEYGLSKHDDNYYALVTAIAKRMLHLKESLTFSKFLKENMNYGSLIDKDVYKYLDDADKALYQYTADGFTDIDAYIDELIKKYPHDGGKVFRGLHFNVQKDHDNFLKSIEDGQIKLSNFSSWTPYESTALDFARSKKTYFPTMDIMLAHRKMQDEGEHMTGYGGVVISTTVGKREGVDVSKSDFAKESEVILPPGTYDVKIVKMMEPFKRKYSNLGAARQLISEIKRTKEKTPEIDKQIVYLRQSWLDKLPPEDVDVIMQYKLGKFLKLPKNELMEKFISFNINKTWNDRHELGIAVYAPIDGKLFEKCSNKLQDKILTQLKYITMGLKNAINEIVKHEDIDKVSEFNIRGIDTLHHFLPTLTDTTVKPLRAFLGKKYHELNSREINRSLKTMNDIRSHGETIAKLISAMQSV